MYFAHRKISHYFIGAGYGYHTYAEKFVTFFLQRRVNIPCIEKGMKK